MRCLAHLAAGLGVIVGAGRAAALLERGDDLGEAVRAAWEVRVEAARGGGES